MSEHFPSGQPAPVPALAPLTGRTHELKTDAHVFSEVTAGRKLFEIRKNDRDFRCGDLLRLRSTRCTGAEMAAGQPLIYTGEEITVRVIGILRGPVYGLAEGWVIMSIAAPAATQAQAEPATWDAQVVYDGMANIDPNWNGAGRSREGAVALALSVVRGLPSAPVGDGATQQAEAQGVEAALAMLERIDTRGEDDDARVDAIAATIRRLAKDVHDLNWALGTPGYEQMHDPADQADHEAAVRGTELFLQRMADAKERHDAMESDAARYRFLRDSPDAMWRPYALRTGGNANDVDALVDAARAAQAGGGKS